MKWLNLIGMLLLIVIFCFSCSGVKEITAPPGPPRPPPPGVKYIYTEESPKPSEQAPKPAPTKTPAKLKVLPTIDFTPKEFEFNIIQGEVDLLTDTLYVSNSGDGTLNWSVSSNFYDIILSPTIGSSTGEEDIVNLSIDIKEISADDYNATITIFGFICI